MFGCLIGMVVGVATGAAVGEGEAAVAGLATAVDCISGVGTTVDAGMVGAAAMDVGSVAGPSGAHAVSNAANRSSSPNLFMAPSFLLDSYVAPNSQASPTTKYQSTTLTRSE